MLKEAFDRDELNRYVHAIRANLDAPGLAEAARQAAPVLNGHGDPQAAVMQNLPDVTNALASSGGRKTPLVPFLARDPVQSLLQSTIEAKLREHGVEDAAPPHREGLAKIIHTCESFLHPLRYGPTNVDWVIEVGKAMLHRVAEGNRPFNPKPAKQVMISDDARVVVVGDWGTGLPRARAVAGFMADEVAEALAAGREAHVIHLGDVYYSGMPDEVQRNVLAPGLWPVTAQQATAGVTSWSLNGNHDMYGGGFGYFDTLLADERFATQRSDDGQPTSFFRLTSASWDIVGLDTSWNQDPLFQGHVGVLEDPQAQFVAEVAGESHRKLMLLSHHQLVSVYDPEDLGLVLGQKLGPVLDSGRVTAWLWGHEHRCMAFAPDQHVKFARCIGHGGVPVLMNHAEGDPVPSPGIWEEREFLEDRGDHWARFGFAVLDFNADQINVRYRDDQGTQTRAEVIS
jgi:Calcineurin-like phosphoesterase